MGNEYLTEKCLTWNTYPDVWSTTIFTWSDCILINEAIDNIGSGTDYGPVGWAKHPWEKLTENEKKKKNRLIQLITYVNENKIINESEIVDRKVTVSEIMQVKEKIEKTLEISF